jgi:uncharacterized protein YndB with AHSA1/START domain
VIDPPEHLLFTSAAFQDDNGDYKLEVNNSVTFEENGGKTTILLHAEVVKSSPEVFDSLAGMEQGWRESFNRLEALLNRK